jgi:hypothetical protein
MTIIECKSVRFYAQSDETAFFEWIGRIKGIRKTKGVGDVLYLHVRKPVSDTTLVDMLALFQRYGISMRQLGQFSTTKNRAWFEDPRKYWFKKVFKRSARTSALPNPALQTDDHLGRSAPSVVRR